MCNFYAIYNKLINNYKDYLLIKKGEIKMLKYNNLADYFSDEDILKIAGEAASDAAIVIGNKSDEDKDEMVTAIWNVLHHHLGNPTSNK